jgi:hypothetical protein
VGRYGEAMVLLAESRSELEAIRSLLRRADRAFDALHKHLSSGGALPSPWLSARR